MTVREYRKLKDGDTVWVHHRYLPFPMPGVVRRESGMMYVYINLFGIGSVQWCLHDLHGDDTTNRDKFRETVYTEDALAKMSQKDDGMIGDILNDLAVISSYLEGTDTEQGLLARLTKSEKLQLAYRAQAIADLCRSKAPKKTV